LDFPAFTGHKSSRGIASKKSTKSSAEFHDTPTYTPKILTLRPFDATDQKLKIIKNPANQGFAGF